MSLDFSRSVAQLPPERRAALIREYRRQAKHDTTAFLYCFFLGAIGAHRMYLGQWGAALPRLLLSAIFIADLALGIPLQWPVVAVIGVAAVLLVVLLGWEIRDLFHIDAEVERYNAALAERLLGAPLVASAQAAAAVAPAAASGIGTITAGDIAGAFALAQGVTAGRVADYGNDQSPVASTTEVAASPPLVPVVTPVAPLILSSPADLTDRQPGARSTYPIADVEDTTDGPVYVALPSGTTAARGAEAPAPSATATPPTTAAAAAVAAAAGIVGAAALPALTRDLTDNHPHARHDHPIADIEGTGAGAVRVALPQATPPSDMSELAVTSDAAAQADDEALLVLVPEEEQPAADIHPWGVAPSAPAATTNTPVAPAPSAAPVPAAAYVPPTISAIEEAPTVPVWPVTPEDAPPAPPIWPVQPSAQPSAYDEDTRTLAELAAFGAAGATAYATEHAREHSPTSEPASPAGAATTGAAAMTDASARLAGSAEPHTLGAAGDAAGAVTPPAAAAPTEAPPAAPSIPMKRVRVVRKIVLEDGGVVRELVAERIVPADADSQAIAAELEAQLGHASPEEIAQLAHLPSDTSVVVRSRVESGPLSGKLTSPSEGSGGGGGGTPPAPGS